MTIIEFNLNLATSVTSNWYYDLVQLTANWFLSFEIKKEI